MARPTLLIVLALILCSNTEAEGQFWERFTLRESFSGSRGRSRPASFAVLLPGDTTPSYSIRTGLRVDLGFGSLGQKVDIGPYVEYRLLTNIKRPQNVFAVGLSADWATRDEEADQQRWSAVMIMRVNFKNDYERVTKSYANVNIEDGTMGQTAKKELFAIRHLSVGGKALEITGEDIDGKQFKLSDYRGKIVLLDFWGDW